MIGISFKDYVLLATDMSTVQSIFVQKAGELLSLGYLTKILEWVGLGQRQIMPNIQVRLRLWRGYFGYLRQFNYLKRLRHYVFSQFLGCIAMVGLAYFFWECSSMSPPLSTHTVLGRCFMQRTVTTWFVIIIEIGALTYNILGKLGLRSPLHCNSNTFNGLMKNNKVFTGMEHYS